MTESQHQQALIKWARLSAGKWPELKYLYAIPNGAHTTVRNKARLIAEGLTAGVSDLHLPVARAGYRGLWIEFKSQKGKLSEAQKDWFRAMRALGHAVWVCRDWYMGVRVLEEYLSLK